MNTDGTLNDLREAVTTLEDTDPIARRVLGGAHPLTRGIEKSLNTREPRSAPAKRHRRGARKTRSLSIRSKAPTTSGSLLHGVATHATGLGTCVEQAAYM